MSDRLIWEKYYDALNRWSGPLLIGMAGLIMMGWTWGTWPDVLVDFGRELYVPWRLTEGEVLFRDVAYFNGPFSPYVNALWFRLFGTSLQTLILWNLIIATALLIGLYRILSDIADRLAASTAGVVFVTVFAFGQLDAIGNYNYICPYSHEMTHGLALSIGAILCLSVYLRRERLIFLSAAGFVAGLVFLTKSEIFFALALALAAGLGLKWWGDGASRRRAAALAGAFCGAAAIPPVGAFLLLSLALPVEQALRGTLGSWLFVFNKDLLSLTFYQWGMGILDPLESLRTIVFWLGVYALVLLPVIGLGLVLSLPARYRKGMAAATFLLTSAVLGLNWQETDVFQATTPLPLFLIGLGVATFFTLVKNCENQRIASRLILRMTMIVFALVLLAKVLFNVRLDHYGFALGMPGTLLAVVTVIRWIPDFITRRGGYGPIFQAAGFAIVLVTISVTLYIVAYRLSSKHYVVSNGIDTFIADERGLFVNATLNEIIGHARPDQSLAVFPEGVMLNYLSRRLNRTPYVNFMPPELIMFGETRILDSFRARPPDYIALVHKNTVEYGFPFFGRDYGENLFAWIVHNYHEFRLIGDAPLQTERFGILLLKRNASQ